jgi:ribosomal protein S18 acetylase RimI-like enzyme
LASAFRLVFRHLPPAERDARVANALHLVQTGDLDPRGVFVLRQPGGLDAALVCAPVPGASAALWPPVSVEDDRRAQREDALMRHACAWLRQQGARLVQALLAPEEEHLADPLPRNGLARVTDLWYLRHDLGPLAAEPAAPPGLTFEPYDPDAPEPFHQALARTYEQTLDCPEVNGARTIEEVVRGHQAQGRHDPDRWRLARQHGEPVGVLVLIEMPESGDWEIAYMGVVPEARRRGLGRALLFEALARARGEGVPRLLLSVDTRNRPAWHLYRSVGFQPFDRRAVYLAVWR